MLIVINPRTDTEIRHGDRRHMYSCNHLKKTKDPQKTPQKYKFFFKLTGRQIKSVTAVCEYTLSSYSIRRLKKRLRLLPPPLSFSSAVANLLLSHLLWVMRYSVTWGLLALLISLLVVGQEEGSWREGTEWPENSSYAAMLTNVCLFPKKNLAWYTRFHIFLRKAFCPMTILSRRY